MNIAWAIFTRTLRIITHTHTHRKYSAERKYILCLLKYCILFDRCYYPLRIQNVFFLLLNASYTLLLLYGKKKTETTYNKKLFQLLCAKNKNKLRVTHPPLRPTLFGNIVGLISLCRGAHLRIIKKMLMGFLSFYSAFTLSRSACFCNKSKHCWLLNRRSKVSIKATHGTR